MKRFQYGDEVVILYRGLAKIPGEILTTPHGNRDSDKYTVIDKDGDRHQARNKNLHKKGCNHELLYHDKEEIRFCPFCDEV